MKLYLDGLERMGNVFLSYVFGNTIGKNVISTRRHGVEVLREYKQDGPFIVPLRDALPSLASAQVYRKRIYETSGMHATKEHEYAAFQSENMIARYDEFLQYLLDNDIFFIAPFDEFTNNTDAFIETFLKKHPEVLDDNRKVKKVDIDGIFKQGMSRDGADPLTGNFPRKYSEERNLAYDNFLKNHGTDIDKLQQKINILYQRYYNIK